MSLTPSNTLEKGTLAPDFTLFDTVSEKSISLQELKGKRGTIIFFICNHCPFVIHINRELVQLAKDYTSRGFSFIAISSNDGEISNGWSRKNENSCYKRTLSFPISIR